MNAITQPAAEPMPALPPHAASPAMSHAALPADGALAHSVTLRRTGRKPLRFDGWLLVEAASLAGPGALHHELRLYRSRRGQIVIELITRREALHAADIERAETVSDLAEAATWLEAHDCAIDMPVPSGLAEKESPLSQAVLQAVALRQHMARVRDEFACLLSDVFAAVGVAELLETAE